MTRLSRFAGICLLVVWLPAAMGQTAGPTVKQVNIEHVGPANVSDELIRGNIHVKPGDKYLSAITFYNTIDEDIRALYATGLFYNIRIKSEPSADGMVLTYVVQAMPRLTEITITGNKKFTTSKIKKKLTSKIGESLNEQKLFSDSQAIQEMYQKAGYPGTSVSVTPSIIEESGRGSVVFEVKESPRVRIKKVEFVGASAFSQKKLRKEIKTRKRWMFSWLTGSGTYKEDQFEMDRDKLAQFYRDKGYIDFEIKDVQFERPEPNKMIIRFHVFEGQPYKVGAITFEGTTMLPTNAISPEFKAGKLPAEVSERRSWFEQRELNRAFTMKEGETFTPKGLGKNIETIENFYGAKGHIDVEQSTGNLQVSRIANTEQGTMDLKFNVPEGQQSRVEKIDIRGNTKTKDKVIRRELTIAPGDVFNMVAVKRSRARLEGLQFFEKVDARPEETEVPNRKNLIIGVEEKNTGNLSVGAGFSSVDSVVGFAEVTQGNFDLFNPPTFTGAGQKFRLRVQMGSRRQDYILSFVEPWFLDRKLAFGTDLYYRNLNYQSLGNLYDESRLGVRLSLTRALWSDYLIGSVSYTIEQVGIDLDSGLHGPILIPDPNNGPPTYSFANVPQALLDEEGKSWVSKVGFSLAYDTRNSTLLPDAGQRTEISVDVAGLGLDKSYYRAELKSAWYIRGFAKGHVLELAGRTGVAESFNSDAVPFYDRYYLGGMYSLRGFRYRAISPREETFPGSGQFFEEPVGGNTYWFGTAEYSIPIIQKEGTGGVRFALFYDIGNVMEDAYDYNFSNYSDNWGLGLRLNLPIGPLRLDYGIPINHDEFSGSSGRFQFGVGYSREF
jgi:outer membrane protein insertion porin family